MYHTKRIGVFISHIFGYYQKNVCQGIIDKALEYGYTAEIFTSMDGENLGTYGIGEESILHIPNYDSLDGVIFASETYPSSELKEKILAHLKTQCSCPIIEIAVTNQHFPAVALENNSTAGELTEHLIVQHDYKRICFLGCSEETFFSDQRENFYRQTMEKYGRTVGAHDVYNCAYGNTCAAKALDYFLTDGKPDAVVCYNDRMALLFMMAAMRKNYNIPEDIAVTGCDNTSEGNNTTPALTTVSFPVYELGTTAVEKLIERIHGAEIPSVTTITAKPVIHNSCGCDHVPNKNAIFLSHELNQRIMSLENSILSSMSMSAAFQRITDIDEGMDLLENYMNTIEHCKECYLCLYANWDSISNHLLEITNQEEESQNSDMITMKLAIKDGKRLPECSYQKTSLLPDYIYQNSDCAYIYNPLFFEDKEFGYIALAYEGNRIDFHFQLVHWLMNINQMLQSIYEAKKTGLLVKHLEDIYMKDALTGLYNKHGYNHFEEPLMLQAIEKKTSLTAFLFDLDGLKQINDNFGHNEGDFAIQVIGHALESAIRPEDICARFSGDEFYLLASGYTNEEAEELLQKVQKYLDNYNKLSNKAYPICTSCGYASIFPDSAYSVNDIKDLFSEADKKMYLEKEAHHAAARMQRS